MQVLDALGSIPSVFLSSVAPPLAIALAGYLLGRVREVDTEPLSTVTVYVLLPALVFETLVTLEVGVGTVTAAVGAMVGFTAVMGALSWAVSRARGREGTVVVGAAMAAAFPNTGNFGIPVATFAFGAAGRSTAVLFVLVQNLLLYTVGVYLLSRGGEGSDRAALGRVARQPVVYALVAAGAAVALGVVPPEGGTAMDTLRLVGDASIPVFLVVLGLQVEAMDLAATVRETLPTVGLKLLVAPVVAVGVALLVDIGDPAVTAAFVVLAAGPSAVIPLVLSIEFGDDASDPSGEGTATGPTEGAPATVSTADYVGTVVFLTILGSLPVVTGLVLLAELGILG
ncbi:AEC family transporter [Halosimplex marinum]|uniref:AEC family transporter n=1 Tax=Halosimplex marinum TaxID=3396620 RepID=UPI003F561A5B